MFNVNQIVKGKSFGRFVIVGIRPNFTGSGETYYQVKEVCSVTGKARRGEMALPESALVEA